MTETTYSPETLQCIGILIGLLLLIAASALLGCRWCRREGDRKPAEVCGEKPAQTLEDAAKAVANVGRTIGQLMGSPVVPCPRCAGMERQVGTIDHALRSANRAYDHCHADLVTERARRECAETARDDAMERLTDSYTKRDAALAELAEERKGSDLLSRELKQAEDELEALKQFSLDVENALGYTIDHDDPEVEVPTLDNLVSNLRDEMFDKEAFEKELRELDKHSPDPSATLRARVSHALGLSKKCEHSEEEIIGEVQEAVAFWYQVVKALGHETVGVLSTENLLEEIAHLRTLQEKTEQARSDARAECCTARIERDEARRRLAVITKLREKDLEALDRQSAQESASDRRNRVKREARAAAKEASAPKSRGAK
jgi:hypothetical protein